jgi:hypothetical protein
MDETFTANWGIYYKKRVQQTDMSVESNDVLSPLEEAEYQGRKVTLMKPFRTPDGPKKFAVYVKNPDTGKVKIVRFGDPNMSIKRDNPERRKNFRARHQCDSPQAQDPLHAKKWSCDFWSKKRVTDLVHESVDLALNSLNQSAD